MEDPVMWGTRCQGRERCERWTSVFYGGDVRFEESGGVGKEKTKALFGWLVLKLTCEEHAADSGSEECLYEILSVCLDFIQ